MNKPTNDKINQYGDGLIENQGKGSDIASQRLDNLDHACLKEAANIAKSDKLVFIDFGTGRCAFINKMDEHLNNQSAQLYAVDNEDFSEYANQHVQFLLSNMESFFERNNINPDIIYSQRTIHYLPYPAAKKFLKAAFSAMKKNGTLYLSASGLLSELSHGYSDKTLPVSERYTRLSDTMLEKHGIREPVCLYKPDELSNLVTESGFTVKMVQASEFGNVKLVAKKND